MCWSPFFRGGLKKCALRPACRLSHKQERYRSPLRRIACKKGRYSIWKVKSNRYDASDFFRQADPRREERQMVEMRGLFDPSYLSDSDSATVSFEPMLNGWVLMRRVVIDNEVEIKFLRGFPVDLF